MGSAAFVPATGTHRTASAQLVIRGTLSVPTVLTSSYVATTTTCITIGWEYVIFGVLYTKGDETSLRIKTELYDGTTWWPTVFKAVQASSYSLLTLDLLEATASLTGALPPVSVVGAQEARISVIANGGTPTGTLAVTAMAGNTVKWGS